MDIASNLAFAFLAVSIEASSPSTDLVDHSVNSYVAQFLLSFFNVEFRECFFPSLLFCLLI